MGVKAVRIYSTDRAGARRVSIFANENQWSDNIRVDCGTEIATVYEDNLPKCFIHGWNHVEYLKDWEPPQPTEDSTVQHEPAILPAPKHPLDEVGF